MRRRTLHIAPWSLAGIYVVWCFLILFRGGDWAPIFLYYPLWPFGIFLEALEKRIPMTYSDSMQYWLSAGIWLIGGVIWCLILGYLISWSSIRIRQSFRGKASP
jgi:hypothetical protein